ncbi:hypothetical protein Emag_006588 [Eimeria magna]
MLQGDIKAFLVPRQEPRAFPVQSFVTPLRREDQVLRRFPRRQGGNDDFPPDYCPPYVLYSRVAFRRLGPPDLDRTFVSPTFWEGEHFADYRGFCQESVFAVLGGPERLMRSGEPCWLVACTLRGVHREMVYDRAMRQIFPHHDLRRFVEIPPRLCPRNMDMEYSYAVAPYRVESNAQVTEDYARRWRAFVPGGLIYPTLRAVEVFPARSEYREPHLRLWVIRRPVAILDTYRPRHPRLPCGRFVDYYNLHSLYPSDRSPPYAPLSSLAPSVASSVVSEETRAQEGQVEEPPPPSPTISSTSTPSTSVGGSAPGSTTPRQAPRAPEPPQRRRRLNPE